MNQLSFKLIIASMIGVQLLQGAGFAGYNSIQDLGNELAQQGIIIQNPQTLKYSETVMRDEMASVITRWTTKHLDRHEEIQQGCRYRDLIRADHAYRQDIKDGCSIGLLTKRSMFAPRGRATQGDAITMLARAINHDATITKQSAYQVLIDHQIIDTSFVGRDDHGFTRYWLYDIMYRMDQYVNNLPQILANNNVTQSSDESSLKPEAIKSTLGMWNKSIKNTNQIQDNNTEKANEDLSLLLNELQTFENNKQNSEKQTSSIKSNTTTTYKSPRLDRDDPSGDGDAEYYDALVPNMQVDWACPEGGSPVSAIAREVGTTQIYTSSIGELEFLNNDTGMGYRCINSKSTSGICKDYEVQFNCSLGSIIPISTTKPSATKNLVVVKGQAYSPVVQVRVYEHDNLFDLYTLVGMGSAVLISDTQAITNAHVAISQDDKPYYIELCTTYDPELKPVCNTTAKVVRYNNTTTDLALLEYTGISNKKLATLGTPPTISDQVTVHGYPVNGQDTITISQGIISGRKGNDYKIDATINHGNSGGGAFDKSGKLIGIPSYGIGDVESIGYIIGVDTIQQFIDKKITSTTLNTDKYTEFSDYIATQQSAKIQGSITTSTYDLKLNNNVALEYSIKNESQGISTNVFGSSDGNLAYMIGTQRIIDGTLNAKTQENIVAHVVPWATNEYKTSKITINNHTRTKAISAKSKDKGIVYVTTSGNIAYTIFSINKSDAQDQGSWILENMTFKTPTLSPITAILPTLKISANNGLIPSVGFDMNTLKPTWVLYSTTNDGHIHFEINEQEMSAENEIEENKNIDDLYKEDDIEIYKNKAGQNLIISKKTSTSFSVGMVAAASKYSTKQRGFLMILMYDPTYYPLYKQLVPWLETISLGGTDMINKSTISTFPSDYFEHKDVK